MMDLFKHKLNIEEQKIKYNITAPLLFSPCAIFVVVISVVNCNRLMENKTNLDNKVSGIIWLFDSL